MGRQSYRQWGQVMVGATGGLIALGVLVAMAGGWVGRSAAGAAWCVLGLAASYAVFLHPCVIVDDRGVSVHNIVRQVVIPWGAVRGARCSWSLIVDAADGAHASWAISGTASPGRDALRRRELQPAARSRAPGGAAGAGAAAALRSGGSGSVGVAGVPGLGVPAIGGSALDIAQAIVDRAEQAHRTRDESGMQGASAVRGGLVWPSVALMLIAVAGVVATAW